MDLYVKILLFNYTIKKSKSQHFYVLYCSSIDFSNIFLYNNIVIKNYYTTTKTIQKKRIRLLLIAQGVDYNEHNKTKRERSELLQTGSY